MRMPRILFVLVIVLATTACGGSVGVRGSGSTGNVRSTVDSSGRVTTSGTVRPAPGVRVDATTR